MLASLLLHLLLCIPTTGNETAHGSIKKPCSFAGDPLHACASGDRAPCSQQSMCPLPFIAKPSTLCCCWGTAASVAHRCTAYEYDACSPAFTRPPGGPCRSTWQAHVQHSHGGLLGCQPSKHSCPLPHHALIYPEHCQGHPHAKLVPVLHHASLNCDHASTARVELHRAWRRCSHHRPDIGVDC